MSLILPKKFFDLLSINCSWNEFWVLYISIYNDNDLDNDDLDGFLTIFKKRTDINQSFDIFMNVVIQLIDMNININPQIINHIIIKLKPFYNICCVAGNTLGIRYKLSDEIRKKMSDKRMGHIGWNRGLTKETDSRLIISEETKLKISKSKLDKKRKPFSDKHKENIRLSKIGISTWSKDRKNPSGRYCSEETRKKMRMAWESRKLLPISVETRKKHSETNKRIGHKPPSWKGKFHTEATKEKMRGNKYGSKNKGNHCKPHTRKSPTKETIEKRNNTRRLNKLKMEENGLK